MLQQQQNRLKLKVSAKKEEKKDHLVTRLSVRFGAPRQSKQRGKCREPIRRGWGYPEKPGSKRA